MQILYPFAKRFIAGEDLGTAIKNIHSLNQSGFLSTIDVLGEDTQTREQALAAKQEYLNLLDQMKAETFPLDLSIKLTQMGLDIDREFCRLNLVDILERAGHHTVRFDMEGSNTTERIIKEGVTLHRRFRNLGLVLQAYLHRTQEDIGRVIEEGISTRLCKGAYREPESIAYQDMDAIRDNFFKQARRLLTDGFQPAIATHDETLIREILSFIEAENIAPGTFFFEMLYGVRRDLQEDLLKKGYRMRIYVPYGKSWLPYTMRRLAERKENILFVLKSLFRETFGLGKLH
ncbi:MAG: proline dehydrogenase family protein [Nitrospina sp.]|nr:proline dehydrogenase family protein [Nitrospina sp.]